MTKKEIEKFIKEYILPTHSNYYLHKNILYKPFGDELFIKGYSFDAGGRNPDAMHVTYFIMPLFVVEETISISYSQELYYAYREGLFNLKRSRNRVWDVRIASRDDAFKLINTIMDKQGEPVLAKLNDAKNAYDAIKKGRKDNIRVYEECAYTSILFASRHKQDTMLKWLIREAKKDTQYDYIIAIRERTELLLSQSTREERIRVLKEFANITISNLKFSHLMPFT
ncbi:MAG: hypothetical protein J0H74_19900 [Chitinophagaceae bacterium]|nr:hypothetical protein [Chitinophagaceae bacterium]